MPVYGLCNNPQEYINIEDSFCLKPKAVSAINDYIIQARITMSENTMAEH